MSEVELPEPEPVEVWIDERRVLVKPGRYTAEQVRAAILAEREANAIKCDAMKTRTHEEPEEVERGFNAALSRAAAAIRRGSV